MMMAAGAESPSVATQSAKTDILQKIGQRGNNHQVEVDSEPMEDEEQPSKETTNARQQAAIEEVSIACINIAFRCNSYNSDIAKVRKARQF